MRVAGLPLMVKLPTLAAVGAALLLAPSPAHAQSAVIYLPGIPGGPVNVDIASVLDRRFYTVVRQAYDFSCGSAALATLLTYHYGIAADEQVAFTGMWDEGDQDTIRQAGFSLLDMKRYLASIGLTGEGYKVDLDQIQATGVPGIALTTTDGYRHFVVIKGVDADNVLVGDPSRGLLSYSRQQFMEIWDGLYFVVADSPELARESFNRSVQWAVVNSAPIDGTLSRLPDMESIRMSSPALALGEL